MFVKIHGLFVIGLFVDPSVRSLSTMACNCAASELVATLDSAARDEINGRRKTTIFQNDSRT
jgi:hypothetical protein